MRMTKTIVQVKAGDGAGWREFDYSKGPQAGSKGASVDVVFVDGSEGSYLTKPDFAPKHVQALSAIIDLPQEFDLEPKQEFHGIAQWKIKDYVGNPASKVDVGSSGQGGESKGGSWESPEERLARQHSIQAQSAIKAAVEVSASIGDADARLAWIEANAARLLLLTEDLAAQTTGAVPSTVKLGIPDATAVGVREADPASRGGDWQKMYDTAIEAYGSVVKLQIATRKNPDDLSLAELEEAVRVRISGG